ncbi:hypothetical protein PLCT2_00049 [Planctomycetaceae bacterium]|nr:hypothetical protein PLCT2_00049 [Planctomycetaceae bacterium]
MNDQLTNGTSKDTQRLAAPATIEIRVDKIASVCHRLNLHKEERIVTENLEAKEGNIIVVRSLGEKSVYGELELEEGRMAKIFENDIIVGALGARNALKGYVGRVPDSVKVGEIINLLNLGGVIGIATGANKDLGPPLKVEVVGMIVRKGKILNLQDSTIPTHDHLDPAMKIPVIAVSGTCMSAGKTKVCATLCQELSKRGLRVNAGKLSGVAARKDLFSFEDHGANMTLSFVDCGLPSTADVDSIAPIGKAIINELSEDKPDVIIVELGDGIIGGYSVMTYFDDAELYNATRVHICCANDPVGAYGAKYVFDNRKQRVDLFSGPVTDNEVGSGYVSKGLGVKAINARNNPDELCDEVCRLLGWTELMHHHASNGQA